MHNEMKAQFVEEALAKERELVAKERELVAKEREHCSMLLENKIRLETDLLYLQGKLKARCIIETAEEKLSIKGAKGVRKDKWNAFLCQPSNKSLNQSLLKCLKGPHESDLGHAIQCMYKTLSQEIHAPTIKIGSGMYEIPLVPNLSESELCIIEKIVTEVLGWKDIRFVRVIGGEEGEEI
jgi:hypothetical protein